ncbi:MAG: hypothetical protein JO147_14445 [Actinobacteria bacterium]|nr:hypothetical protein [Actinomycetota bacterium]
MNAPPLAGDAIAAPSRFARFVIRCGHPLGPVFEWQRARQAAVDLVADVDSQLLDTVVSAAAARASAQDTTVANVRTRAISLLSAGTVMLTLAAGVGLLASDTSNGGHRLDTAAAWTVVVLVGLMALITALVQWPLAWTFDAGTDVYVNRTKAEAARAVLLQLEYGTVRNAAQINGLLAGIVTIVLLLAAETIVLIVDLALA